MKSQISLFTQIVFVPIHDSDELLSNILSSLHRPGMYEVFETPRIAEFGCLPCVVYSLGVSVAFTSGQPTYQKREEISLGLMKSRFLCIRLSLFVLRSIINLASGLQHSHDGERFF